MRYNSLVLTHQNVPVTSILTDFTPNSRKHFDVRLSLIGSKEIIWITSFDNIFMNISDKKTFFFRTFLQQILTQYNLSIEVSDTDKTGLAGW